MYQYVLAQADKIPVIFQHWEKFPQEEFVQMFNTCLQILHSNNSGCFINEDVGKLMKEKYGFEDTSVEVVIYSPSVYAGLFTKKEPFQKGNVIHTEFDFQYWKQNKKKEG